MSTDGSAMKAAFLPGFIIAPTVVFISVSFIALNTLSIYSIGWIIRSFFPQTREYLSLSTTSYDGPPWMGMAVSIGGLLLICMEVSFIVDSVDGLSKPWTESVWKVGQFAVGGAAGILLMEFVMCIIVKMVMVLVLRGGTNKEKE
jgi:hypothetical protein